MKSFRIFLLIFLLPIISLGQIKIKDLPKKTTAKLSDNILVDDSAGTTGSTGIMTIENFAAILPGGSSSNINSSPLFFARTATTASLTVTYATNTLTATSNGRFAAQDGVVLTLGDYLLVKNQTNNKLQQGLFELYDTGTVSSTAKLVRVDGYNETSEIYPSQISVTEGTANGGRYYLQTAIDPVIGTDDIVYVSTPAPTSPVYPVAFVDIFTTTTLPNSPAYTNGSNINNPGLNALYTATTNGAFPSLQGITPQNGTKILVRAQTDSTKNGDYVFLNVGGSSSKWKIKRINYNATQLYPKLWEVSQGTSEGLIFQQNNKSLVTSTIGTSGKIYFTSINPPITNIYNTDGAQDDPLRTVTVGTNSITFTGSSNSKFFVDCDYNYIGNGSNAYTYINGYTASVEATGPAYVIAGTSANIVAPTIKLNPPFGVASVIVGANSGSASAILDLTATTKGFLPPRMTTTQRDAIASPANGLMIYNSTDGVLNAYQNNSWGVAGNQTQTLTLTGAVTGSGTSSFVTSLGSFTSSSLSTALTDETGSGAAVFATSPTFTTPLLGTPTSGVLTNCTGTASGLTAGNVTTNANLTGEVTSVGNAATLSNSAVIGKVLTGYTSGAGTVSATDNILQAIQKLNGNIAGAVNISNANLSATASHTLALNGYNQTFGGGQFTLVGAGNTSATTLFNFKNSDGVSYMYGKNDGQICLGLGASINSTSGPQLSVVIGAGATDGSAGNRTNAISIGAAATSGYYGVCVGGDAVGTNSGVTVGAGASTTGTGGISIGFQSVCTGTQGAAVGYQAESRSTACGAFGYYARATSTETMALGIYSLASAARAVNIGNYATTSGVQGITLSSYSQAGDPITNSYAKAFALYLDNANQEFYVNSKTNIVLNNNTALVSGTHYDASATNTTTVFNGTAPSSNIANAYQIYSVAGQATVRSSAGVITTIGGTSGSFSGVGTATTSFTVSIGSTLPNATYKVNVTPTAALSAALFYVTNKTTTTFDVVYLAGLTGTVTFDWTTAP